MAASMHFVYCIRNVKKILRPQNLKNINNFGNTSVPWDASSPLSMQKMHKIIDLVLRMKSLQVSIKLFEIGNTDKMKLIVYHDASYANLQDGFIIFVTDHNECKASPIAWQSRKLKRVVKSTLAAETLS